MSEQGFTIAEALKRDRRVNGPARGKSTDKGGSMFRCAIDGCGKPSLGSSLFCAEHRASSPSIGDLRESNPLRCIIPGCQKPVFESKRFCEVHGSADVEGVTDTGTWKFPPAHPGPSGYADPVGASLRIPRPAGLPPCEHRGLTPIVTLKDGRELYAAQGARLDRTGHLDLIVDCAGLVNGRKFVTSNSPRYRALNSFASPDVVRLSWPDMTAPTHVGLKFWTRLLEMLPQRTAVACVGGHGRTGTCLACLLVADGMTGEEAIKTVREKHCVKAIETVAQEQYIRRLAGEKEGRS